MLVLLLALAAGCGGGPASPESVVRAWSQSVNTDDNEAAARLFAAGAHVIQGGQVIVLRSYDDALEWNTALPCSGRILSIATEGEQATATFLLGDRRRSRCDGPGAKATAVFEVRKGKIVLWHQTGSTPPATETV